jgi:hypothetical protein
MENTTDPLPQNTHRPQIASPRSPCGTGSAVVGSSQVNVMLSSLSSGRLNARLQGWDYKGEEGWLGSRRERWQGSGVGRRESYCYGWHAQGNTHLMDSVNCLYPSMPGLTSKL